MMRMEILQLRDENDAFREWGNGDGRWVMSEGLQDDPFAKVGVLDKVRNYRDFDPEDEADDMHDFGAFDHHGRRIYWKIDVMDSNGRYAGEDAFDPRETRRLLTVMLADEY